MQRLNAILCRYLIPYGIKLLNLMALSLRWAKEPYNFSARYSIDSGTLCNLSRKVLLCHAENFLKGRQTFFSHQSVQLGAPPNWQFIRCEFYSLVTDW
jgi:hypothetical protein